MTAMPIRCLPWLTRQALLAIRDKPPASIARSSVVGMLKGVGKVAVGALPVGIVAAAAVVAMLANTRKAE